MIELNLLPHLHALLEIRSVSRAADRMNLSQSAMSRLLSRLRDSLGDELLVRTGNQMVPTARALELGPVVRNILEDARRLTQPPESEPRLFDGSVTVLMTDHVGRLIMPSLLQRVHAEAPRLSLWVRHPGAYPAVSLRRGDADLWIDVPTEDISGLRARTLFEEGYLCLAGPRNPIDRDASLEAWAASDHGVVSVRGWGSRAVDRALEAHGLERRVVATVPSFALAGEIARKTALMFTLPGRLGEIIAREHGLRAFSPPLALARLCTRAMWHPRSDDEPRLRWLRRIVLSLFREPRGHGLASLRSASPHEPGRRVES